MSGSYYYAVNVRQVRRYDFMEVPIDCFVIFYLLRHETAKCV